MAEHPLYPLTRGQERIWVREQNHVGNESPDWATLWLNIKLGPEAPYSKASSMLKSAVQRHESLRTLLERRDDGSIWQRICEPAEDYPLEFHSTEDDLEQATRNLGQRLMRPRFDLFTELPFRAGVVTSDPGSRLVIAFHHIAVDDWSLQVLQAELAGTQHPEPQSVRGPASLREIVEHRVHPQSHSELCEVPSILGRLLQPRT